MNHTNAIDELSDIRDKHLRNAAIAHAENRQGDRDTELDYANSLSGTIRQIQGITEPELPGLSDLPKSYIDKALAEVKRDAWNSSTKSLVGLEEVPSTETQGPTVSFVPVLEPVTKRTTAEDWMPEARDQMNTIFHGSTLHRGDLEKAVRVLANWMESAAQNQRNTDYYRGLLDECAKHLGPEVFQCDDGVSISDEPLRAKIPELVAKLADQAVAVTPKTSDYVIRVWFN